MYIYIYSLAIGNILVNERFFELLIETSRLSDSPLKVYRLIDRKRSVSVRIEMGRGKANSRLPLFLGSHLAGISRS